MNKIYQAIGTLELHTNIQVGADVIRVSFVGGSMYPQRKNGTYATTDKDVQEAIEASKGFNVRYKLIEEIPTEEDTADDNRGELMVLEDITTVQQAKEYLLQNYEGLSANKLRTISQINEVCRELGLSMPNL